MQWFSKGSAHSSANGKQRQPLIIYTGRWANGCPSGKGTLYRRMVDIDSTDVSAKKKVSSSKQQLQVSSQSGNFPIQSEGTYQTKLEFADGASYEGGGGDGGAGDDDGDDAGDGSGDDDGGGDGAEHMTHVKEAAHAVHVGSCFGR